MDNRTGTYQIWTVPILFDSSYQSINPPTFSYAVADTFTVNLHWRDNSDNELGFVIERKNGPYSGSNQFVTVDTVSMNITEYTDTNLTPNTIYTYRMFSYNLEYVSEYSNYIEVMTMSDSAAVEAINSLHTNYPNPFKSTTAIKFSLANYSSVKLLVFDTLGNQVGTLVNKEFDKGEHEITFDGSYLASGVYFYQLVSDSFTETKKMILLK
jgi:hypothetical protein